jgi:site-specific DNA-methyltransferase (cytosine-N4-specific)
VQLAEAAGLTPAHLSAIRSVGVTDAGKAQTTQTGYGKNATDVAALAAEAKAALGGYYREYLLTAPETVGWRPVCRDFPRTSEWVEIPRREKLEDPGDYAIRVAPIVALQLELVALWEPYATIPPTVLDCFGGSGTTGAVAQSLGRRAVLIELNPEYIAQALARIGKARGRGDGPALDVPVPFAGDGLWSDEVPA